MVPCTLGSNFLCAKNKTRKILFFGFAFLSLHSLVQTIHHSYYIDLFKTLYTRIEFLSFFQYWQQCLHQTPPPSSYVSSSSSLSYHQVHKSTPHVHTTKPNTNASAVVLIPDVYQHHVHHHISHVVLAATNHHSRHYLD